MDPSPRESMHRVKSMVASELEALDRTATVKTTDYFNHTFAPDIVMGWRDQPSREVFLRLDREAEDLVAGAHLIGRGGSLLLALGPEGSAAPASSEVFEELPPETMISSPDAIDVFIERRERAATGPMLANAVAQGGKGVVYAPQARVLAESLESGLAAAALANVERTDVAVTALAGSLADPQAARLTRVLQAVWEGGTGRLDEFPGPKDLSGRLGKEALQYLVDLVENDGFEFWHAIGRRLTVADLIEVDPSNRPANFNALVRANLDVLEARACAVIDDPQRELESNLDAAFWWSVRNRRLSLYCPGYFAVLGESKPDIEPLSAGPGRGLPVETFVARAEGWPLHEVAIHTGVEGVTHTAEEGPLDQRRLVSLAYQLGPSVEVRRAVVESPSGRVTVDFSSATGTGVTRSRVLAADVLRSTVPLVRSVSDSEAVALGEALYYEESGPVGGAQSFIFEDDEPGRQ